MSGQSQSFTVQASTPSPNTIISNVNNSGQFMCQMNNNNNLPNRTTATITIPVSQYYQNISPGASSQQRQSFRQQHHQINDYAEYNKYHPNPNSLQNDSNSYFVSNENAHLHNDFNTKPTSVFVNNMKHEMDYSQQKYAQELIIQNNGSTFSNCYDTSNHMQGDNNYYKYPMVHSSENTNFGGLQQCYDHIHPQKDGIGSGNLELQHPYSTSYAPPNLEQRTSDRNFIIDNSKVNNMDIGYDKNNSNNKSLNVKQNNDDNLT